MKNEDKLFSFACTARMLSMSTTALGGDLNEGIIEGERRGKRIKFSQKSIDEYRKKQKINNETPEINFDDYPGVDKVEV